MNCVQPRMGCMSMGLRLRQVRMRAGFSLRNLAILLGVSHSTIGHWEAGRRVPNALMLGKFATVTGVDLNWLFFGNRHHVTDVDEMPRSFVKEAGSKE